MSMPAERIPVIVGIGEMTEHLAAGQVGQEPLALLAEAIGRALADAGASAADDLRALIDSVELVNQMGWSYDNLARQAANAAGLQAAHATQSPVGGNMPTKLLAEIGERIACGEQQAAVICGAEATASLMAAGKLKQTPPWTAPAPAAPRARFPEFFHPEALKYGLHMPPEVYPLYDNACRAAWGQSFAEAQAESGQIGAQMSQAASENPYAWLPQQRNADAISTPSADNRMVSYPYTKLMIANPVVNQASALIVTSLAQARRLGIPDRRLVYVWSGAGGSEPRDILARASFTQAPALEAVLRHTLDINGIDAAALDFVELYSCFPSVPKLARRALGLPAGQPLSVTGGLVFFGAPVNNYMGHAICAMVRALRAGSAGSKARTGLLYGNGEYVTKHHAVIVSSQPPKPGHEIRNADLQAQLDAAVGAVPAVLPAYTGQSQLESYTVKYGRDGAPERATIVARTPDGQRHLAHVPASDAATLAALVAPDSEPVGMTGSASVGEDGFIYWKRA